MIRVTGLVGYSCAQTKAEIERESTTETMRNHLLLGCIGFVSFSFDCHSGHDPESSHGPPWIPAFAGMTALMP
jgi:hypothetical protein